MPKIKSKTGWPKVWKSSTNLWRSCTIHFKGICGFLTIQNQIIKSSFIISKEKRPRGNMTKASLFHTFCATILVTRFAVEEQLPLLVLLFNYSSRKSKLQFQRFYRRRNMVCCSMYKVKVPHKPNFRLSFSARARITAKIKMICPENALSWKISAKTEEFRLFLV